MTAQQFRKKPVVVEARQLIDDLRNHTEIATWITVNGGDVDVPFAESCLYIKTLEGRMKAEIGDWIIKGVANEFYPCKPDIFEKSYEPAEGASAPESAEAKLTAIRAYLERQASDFSESMFAVCPQDMRVGARDILAIIDYQPAVEAGRPS
jgi:hypothetical protein